MRRRIVGFELDEVGDWRALLDCLHRQHVRHQPPFRLAPWVLDETERERRIGTTLDCPLCDRCEIPADLAVVRTTPTWDEATMPDPLRRAHRVASGRWGRLHVIDGSLRFVAATDPPTDVILDAPDTHGIPPDVDHYVEPQGAASFAIDFLAPRA